MRSRHTDLIRAVLLDPFVGNIHHGAVDVSTTIFIESRTHFGDFFFQDFEILLAASTRQTGAFSIAFQAFLTPIRRLVRVPMLLMSLWNIGITPIKNKRVIFK